MAQEALQWRLREAFLGDDTAAFAALLRHDPPPSLDFVYGEPAFEPLVLTACRRHDLDRVRRLRNLGADLNARDLSGDRPALLWAAENADLPLLRLLLGEESAGEETSFIDHPARGVDLNMRDSGSRCALHLLLGAAARPRTADAALRGVRLLCAPDATDVNARDEAGRTPLACAVDGGLVEVIGVLAEAGAELTGELRAQLEAAPALRHLVQAFTGPGRARPAAALLWEAVRQGAADSAADRLQAALAQLPSDPAERRVMLDAAAGLHTCLQWTAHRGAAHLAQLLLSAGAAPLAATRFNTAPPLLYAAERGDADLVALLLAHMRDPPAPLDLTAVRDTGARGMDETAVHRAARHGSGLAARAAGAHFDECLRLLLAERVDVNHANVSGETPLHLALRAGGTAGAQRLMAAGASLAAENRHGVMPVDLVRPETLEEALNACVAPARADDSKQYLLSADCQLQIDFRCLSPPERPQASAEMPVLMRVRNNPLLRPLLRHPVLTALLYLKYDRVRHFYYVHVALQLALSLLLTVFVFGLDGRGGLWPAATSDGVRAALTVGLALFAAKELAQMALAGAAYWLSLENLAELSVCALGLPLVWAPLSAATAQHVSAWLMVVTWLAAAMTMGRLPTLARYKTMMESIALSFGRLIFLYFGLVLAFAIAFYLVYSDVDAFATFAVSVPKAIAMATGEFDYGDLSGSLRVDEARGLGMAHVVSAVLLFICFLFIIFIVLMNLLTALAVDDTKAIMDNAEVMAQDNRIVLLSSLEDVFMLAMLPRALRPGGTSPQADGAPTTCSGLKHAVLDRVLLFHSALRSCVYEFLPNRVEAEVSCRSLAHGCRQRQCGGSRKLCCFGWPSLDDCAGAKVGQLCELPAEMRHLVLALAVKQPTLQEQVDKLQGDLTQLASMLYKYLEMQNLKRPVARQ